MRKNKISDFTGGDAIKLVIVLYAVKELYRAIDILSVPKLRRMAANLEEKIRIRKAAEVINKSSE